MSLNGVSRDKNGKLLKPGQWAKAEIDQNNKGSPIFIFGKVMFVGKRKSYVQPDERRGDEIENSKIEIEIDIRIDI